MIDWLRALRAKKAAPLTGAPVVRRLKTYSAESGYVYQYWYAGHRAAERASEAGTDYVFEVSSDRKTYAQVAVFLAADVVASWERQNARTLAATEQYAIAKLALFRAFDERPDPDAMRFPVRISHNDVDAIAETLGWN
jgi:hypothetical protein